MLNDISIVSLVFTLPVLEPLTSQRLSNIVTMVMACLQAAVSAVMATAIVDMATTGSAAPTSNKEEHIDTCGKMIMHRAVRYVPQLSVNIGLAPNKPWYMQNLDMIQGLFTVLLP